MKRCTYCDALILAGGIPFRDELYCSDDCAYWGEFLSVEPDPTEVSQLAKTLRRKNCPVCNRTGPFGSLPERLS